MNEIIINPKSELKRIIFIFHGYGANKENLLPIGKEFSNKLNDVEIHIPDGIEICEEGFGFQWFPLIGNNVANFRDAFYTNKPIIESYVNKVAGGANISLKNVVFAGFSQGGMLSLSLGLSMKVGAIISFSGIFLEPDMEINNCDTKILMTHGDMDIVLPISAMYDAKKIFESKKIDVQTLVCPGIPHGIDGMALKAATDFLIKN